MSFHGELTAKIGDYLANSLRPRGFDVLYDHGNTGPDVGRIVSWFGRGPEPHHANELSQLDIAIVQRSSGRVLALIEVEETNDRPKNILGDIFGTLMGDHITFRGEPLTVGEWTTLIVLGMGDEMHAVRDEFMARLATAARRDLSTANSVIGKLFVESFRNESQLEPRLAALVGQTIRDFESAT